VFAKYFCKEIFLAKLAYLSDSFEKLNTLNTSMQGNDAYILLVTDKVNAFVRKISLWIGKLEENSLDAFSHLKDFVEENSIAEISESGIEQCIKTTWFLCSPGFLNISQE
jgi:hypothetical protein